MSELLDLYKKITARIKEINNGIRENESAIQNRTEDNYASLTARIKLLEEQIVKIDDYLLKVKGFQELAKKNLDSQNVLTIEAPEGYRVNLNRLRNWATMIDPQSKNDPYAQRVYIVAKCDEKFLEDKRREFTDRIASLKANRREDKNDELDVYRRNIETYREELRQYAASDEITRFAGLVLSENSRYDLVKLPNVFVDPGSASPVVVPGAYDAPFDFEKEQKIWFKSVMKDYYDVDKGRVMLPVEIDNHSEYVINITCNPSRRAMVDRALQNFLFSSVLSSPAGSRKIRIIDAVRYNSASLGDLRKLEGSYVLDTLPRNPEQLTASLENIVSYFADIDELLELYDSVSEYNQSVSDAEKIPLTTLVIYGWPQSYAGRDRELIQRIMTNYERYGVSFITVRYGGGDASSEADFRKSVPEYALQNAVKIDVNKKDATLTMNDGAPQRFKFYTLEKEIPQELITSILKCETKKKSKGNEYTSLYNIKDLPHYVREYKKLELPFGLDGKEQAHSLAFENENFATYLVGASRSGKSTLLHTLIAGLIYNYHPDNVELWLADFKQLEFKRYINHLPPHVKYVLLDESTELVYDLIDKLTQEMMERQKLFARLGVQRIDQVDPVNLDSPLPLIFVILDEFSIMSQSIAESEIYKLKLQNILAKGAALGIRFLFSSQTFTTGIAGLTSTARAQIQQRIAMKGAKEEISETLELSANLKTEQVNNWMDALPPHYALVKFRLGPDTLPQVKRYLVMYFADYDDRDRMIENINSHMKCVDKYDPSDISTYVDKHPVLVDGNTYDAFSDDEFESSVKALVSANGKDLSGDETFVAWGTPRLMEHVKLTAMSSETRENILLISRTSEQACTASIIMSAIRSFRLQKRKVQIWAYSKNRLYRAYKDTLLKSGVEVFEDIDAVCGQIRRMKQDITNKTAQETLIVMIGMERICMDFDYITSDDSADKGPSVAEIRQEFVNSGAVASTDEEKAKAQAARARGSYKRREKARLIDEGMNEADVEKELKKLLEEYDKNNTLSIVSTAGNSIAAKTKTEVNGTAGKVQQTGAYNAASDLEFIIKQGSRQGCHFMMNLNAVADVKQCGMKIDYFRYRLTFQVSADDSRTLLNSKVASSLPEHICQYYDTIDTYSFRPYLFKDIGWDGWFIGEDGQVVSPYE